MTTTPANPDQIADYDTERVLVAMVAMAPEFWPDVAHLQPEAFGSVRARNAWLKLSAALRAGTVPDPRDYGEFIGFDPPALVRDFARDYADRIARDAYCRSAVWHCSDVARAAFARDTDALAGLLASPPRHNGAGGTLQTMRVVGSEVWDSLTAENTMLATGLRALDAVCGEGLERKTFTILMGRPGMGKSAALCQSSDAVSESGGVVAVFSKEMSAAQWYRRIACRRARVNWFRYKRNELPEDYRRLLEQWVMALMDRTTLYIDDSTPQSTAQLQAQCERLAEQHGRLDLVIADHLRLFSDGADNENHRLGKISWGLKTLAKRLDTRVLCGAQLSRAVEHRQDKAPDLPDLRDSGEIEENADNVIGLYRPAYYDKSADDVVEFHARKVREGERGNVGAMRWEAAYMGFAPLQRDDGDTDADH